MARRSETHSSAEETPAAPVDVASTPPLDNGAPPGDPPAPPGDPKPAEPEKLTPREWAHRKGLLFEPSEKQPWVEPHSTGFHSSAAQLHGWNWHAHNFQDPKQAFTLTEADYDAALEAAGEFPALPAHETALAPGFPKPVVPEHIAKACAAARAKPEANKSGA